MSLVLYNIELIFLALVGIPRSVSRRVGLKPVYNVVLIVLNLSIRLRSVSDVMSIWVFEAEVISSTLKREGRLFILHFESRPTNRFEMSGQE